MIRERMRVDRKRVARVNAEEEEIRVNLSEEPIHSKANQAKGMHMHTRRVEGTR